jgi:hypothetical protein
MALDDHAILVGISRYCDQTFGALNGPPNDVERMRSWLVSGAGGNLPASNVVVLTSPTVIPADTDPNDWEPGEAQFNRAFRQLVVDPESGEPIRRQGRLYLYFSGHGFSERRDQSTRAALFAANATRFFPSNICGTIYAQSAREQALFTEIVLIMDCCRDAELNLPFSQPAINSGTSDAATGVRFMALYGAPKGGKAQERSFPELNGMTCGLLTHALLKGLSETPPDGTGTVSSTALKRYLFSTWATVCGDTPAAEPEFVSPTAQDIQFTAVALGVIQGFVLTAPPGTLVTVDILDSAKNQLVRCALSTTASTVEWNGQVASNLPLAGLRFELRLQPGLYRCVVTGDIQKAQLFEADGAQDVSI